MNRKDFYKILILFFVTLTFFIARNVSNTGDFKTVSKLNREESSIVNSKVDLSGPLTVINDVVSVNDNSLLKSEIIRLTNKSRLENGVSVILKENNKLDLSAEKKVKDMFARQYFEHISPSGVGIGDLSKDFGYNYILIGENLALGNFKDEESLVKAWMDSPGHRANILNIKYQEIGVYVLKGKMDGKEVWLAVQHFGTPSSVCPSVDYHLHDEIIEDKLEISNLEKDLIERQDLLKRGIYMKGSSKGSQIDDYNSLLDYYNKIIDETRNKVDLYNKQINYFNECVYSYQ